MSFPKRGEIYWYDFTFCNMHPALIVSNDKGNKHGDLVTVVYLSTQVENIMSKNIPTNIYLPADAVENCRADYIDRVVVCNVVETTEKDNLGLYVGRISKPYMKKVENALKISLGLKGGLF